MRQPVIIFISIFFLAGFAGCATYAQREQISIGMTKQDIAAICKANRIYSCERLYEDNKVVTYRLFLLDTHKNFRPYKCGFSHDGVLLWIGLDHSYEVLLMENAAGFIRRQSDMRDSEPMYWSR